MENIYWNPELVEDLTEVLNRHSQENASNTPDYMLATYLLNCLHAYNMTVRARSRWFEETKGS